MKDTVKGAWLVIGAMTIFGLYGIFSRFISAPPHVVVFFLFLVSGSLIFAFFLIKDRKILFVRKHVGILLLLAIVNIFNNYFFFQSFLFTTISNAVLMHYTAPIFVAVLAPIFLKEKLESITIKALIIAAIGSVLIAASGDLALGSEHMIGILYGLGSGLMYALVIMIIKSLSGKISVYAINAYQAVFAALFLLPFVLLTEVVYTLTEVSLLVSFGILFGVIATLLHMHGIKLVKSQHAATLAYIEPAAAALFAFLFFFEIPAALSIVGGILILFSGYMIIRGHHEKA